MATLSGKFTKEDLKKLYDEDYPLWVETNLQLLKDKAYELVDWDNLLMEIEDMGLRHLEACISYLAVILEHLYKLDNFKHLAGGDKAGDSWIRSIENSKDEIVFLFKRHPSLKVKLIEYFDTAWDKAKVRLRRWLRNNGYNPDDFNISEKCPYTYEEALSKKL
ncbi:DUF29 domain-containing protein [Sulfurihydrogenibium sp.]|uniref:DUF29 domain-containing protein n=1 Tax=Sulfurihydrogenibium sp. TaxID=2053621 RepID=UPI002625306F|nr:DUF29 domain-containing protein [Sulfurihydrogenibium sp.]